MDDIRARVLRGIALNRTPGFHFAGNFLGIELIEAAERTRVALAPSAHSVDVAGHAHTAAVFMAADIALASSIRSQLAPSQRLVTVSLHLQMNGTPLAGDIEAHGQFAGFARDAASRLGLARVRITANGEEAGVGHGAFMALDPPPGVTMHPLQARRLRDVAPAPADSLDATEREILRRAEAALAEPGTGSFLERFFGILPRKTEGGASCPMPNGAHVGNRVGHAQGGILMALAAETANAAMGEGWRLASIAAAFVSPGEGDTLEASSTTVHRGRWTGAARTDVIAAGGRRVLDAGTTHARRAE